MSSSAPITTRPHLVEFSDRFVQPPTHLYVDPDDRLYVEFASRFLALDFHVAARILKPGGAGEIIHNEFELRTADTATEWQFVVRPMQEGFLLGVTVHPTVLVTGPGDLYVLVGLLRGTDVRQSATQILCSGYVEGPHAPTWPAGTILPPSSGRGEFFNFTGVDPAAGSEISFTIGDFTRARLHSMRFPLVTDATVANRRMILEVVAGGNVAFRVPAQVVQTASLSWNYNVAHWGMDGDNRNGELLVNFPPDMILRSGDIIRTTTPGLQAGDDYGTPQVLVERWLAEL